MRRWLCGLLVSTHGLAFAGTTPAQITIADARIDVPQGWVEVSRDSGTAILSTPDRRQFVTITQLRFGAAPGLEDFKRICGHRIEAEREDGPEVFIKFDPPFGSDGSFSWRYSGGNKATSRIFSGYLSLSHKQLITVYVEGVGVSPGTHLVSFSTWVKGVHRAP